MAASLFQLGRIAGIGGAGEAVVAIVGELEAMIEIAGLGDGQDGSENLLLENPGFAINVGDYGWPYEIAVAAGFVSAGDQAPFGLAGLDIGADGLFGFGRDDGAHVVGRVVGGALSNGFGFGLDEVQKPVVNSFMDDGAGAGGTLLPLKSEGRLDDPGGGGLNVAFVVDEDRILAAHFGDNAFDPDAARGGPRREFVNAQTDFTGAGKGNEAGLRMGDKCVADFRAAAHAEMQRARWKPGFAQDFDEFRGDDGGFAGRFQHHCIAANQRGDGGAGENGERKIPRRNHNAHAERQIHHFALFAGHLHDGTGRGVAQHLARVVFAEVDGLGGVGLRFGE